MVSGLYPSCHILNRIHKLDMLSSLSKDSSYNETNEMH